MQNKVKIKSKVNFFLISRKTIFYSNIIIQSNLSIVDTKWTFQKCSLYGGVHFREVELFLLEYCEETLTN